MSKLYAWIDGVWQFISKTVFVRFEYDILADNLKPLLQKDRVVFAIPYGGIIEWLILSSWCRSKGLGAILVSNRKRILLFAKPKYFFQILFRRKSYADLFLSKEPGPRLLFCPNRERKRLFTPTASEELLSGIYLSSNREEEPTFYFMSVVIRWRKHSRGTKNLSEYLFGLSSRPNFIGKMWYLLRRRHDSVVKGLAPFSMKKREKTDGVDLPNESEAMRVAKYVRRKILVLHSQEMRVVLGPRYQNPHAVKETIIRDPDIQKLISQISEEKSVDRKKLMTLAYKYLTEIVAIYRYRFIEVMYVMLTWLFTKIFDGVNSRETEVQRVREVVKNKSVVFISAHRSHLDYLLIPYVFFLNDIVTPHVAAGINMAFWPMGHFFRLGGAFFIRRTFRGQKLYSLCLRKYIEYLLKTRVNISFFIEGTRSRSGKMLSPAFGMLKMTLDAYRKGACDDIALIPISVCYDEVPELSSYSKELAGAKKVKESASELIKSRRITGKKMGKAYVRFAPELLAKDLFRDREENGEQERLAFQKIAFQVSKNINDITPVTPKSLVSSVLLGYRLSSVSLEDLLRLSFMLAEYVEASGHALSVVRGGGLRRALEQTVRLLQKNGIVNVSSMVPRTFFCENKRRVVLNYYKNNAIHCFISPCITLLALFSCLTEKRDQKTVALDIIIEKSLKLRDFVKFEFFFNPTQEFIEEMKKNLQFFFGGEGSESLDTISVESLKSNTEDWNALSVYTRLVGELLESYLVVLEFFKEAKIKSSLSTEKKTLVQKIVKFAESRASKQRISFPESVSIQNYSNALLLLNNKEILEIEKGDEKTTIHFKGWDEKAESLMAEFAGFFEVLEKDLDIILNPDKGLDVN